jgi:predicted O-methyltransferase YrrM
MEWDSWFSNKTFTTDWTSSNFSVWARHLVKFRDHAAHVLEIGSWEGRSAIFFLEFLPGCHITCIDTFEVRPEHTANAGGVVSSIESRFDSNLVAYSGRVRKIKSRSLPALDQLAQASHTFDLIYIDGSHARSDVLIDSVLAWPMLKANGICIWDDYIWGAPDVPSAQRPQDAIDAFLDMHSEELQIRHSGAQIIVEKRPGIKSEHRNRMTFPRTPANLLRFLKREPMRFS